MKSQVRVLEEMPYEKFEKYGLEALTDSDLLAILLRTGTMEMNVQQLAQHLLTYNVKGHVNTKQRSSLISLYEFSYEQLQDIKGIGKVKALQIMSLLELSKRIAKERHQPNTKISSPRILAQYFMEILRHEQKECFIVTFLDAKCKMMGYQMISTGSLTASVVHPREVYKIAIQKSAHSIIVLHNHPSGDPSPSKEDIQISERLKKVGELIGIPLLDHIIIGDGIYKSLKEESYL